VDHSNNAEFIRVIVAIPQKTLKDILEIDPNIVFSIGRFSTAIFK
jgi:hypothetical protein